MKFLNHLDLNENEARKLKMYRVSSSAYTPSNVAGNIIFDTLAGQLIPKWWDGSNWRDFSYNTTGGTDTTYDLTVPASTTKIRLAGSDSTNDDVEIFGGTNVTVTRTSATKLTLAATNTTYTAGTGLTLNTTTFDANTWGINSSANASADSTETDERWYGVHTDSNDKLVVRIPWTDTDTNTQNAYAISAADGTNTSREKIVLTGSGAAGSTTDFIEIGAGTGMSIARSGDVITLTNTVTNTNTSVNTTDGTYIDFTPNSASTGSVTVTADLSAVDGGFGEAQRVLSKNNTWVPITSIQNNTDVDVDNSHLLTRLAALESAGGAANQDIVIGTDSGDTIVITGNLKVNGTTTTVNSNTVEIGDSIIELNSDETGTPSANAGIEIERGTSANVGITWTESNDTWYLSEATNQTNGGSLVSKKIIQNVFTTVGADDSNTVSVVTPTSTVKIAGSNGIATTADNTNKIITVSGASIMSQFSKVATIGATGLNASTNKIATITHSLGTKDVVVRLYETNGEGDYTEIYADVTVTSTSVVKVQFSANLTVDVRAVIMAAKSASAVTPTYS